ncbi:MAG TPA: TetR/AcrR family transcriptional regulator [Streptosporangiaceae bacterium]|jgi:TetR/AcrR family transcriptional regulator, cholesterol catabolism regulator|nr:TetR/AcrR family transcriptional regulator [Streptosporangiaceae bacterium]
MTSPVPDTTRQLSRSQAQRRQKIIDAALALCLSEGHAQTQMRDIADTAGLALGTVYRYFPSKELLLASVFEKWCEGYWEMLGVASEGQANMDRLIDLACRSAQAYIDEPNILLMINSLRSGVEPAISEKFGEITQRAAQFFIDNLHGLPDEAAVGIVDTVFCVLQAKLSVWVAGQITTEQVYQDIAKTVRLLLEFRDET